MIAQPVNLYLIHLVAQKIHTFVGLFYHQTEHFRFFKIYLFNKERKKNLWKKDMMLS